MARPAGRRLLLLTTALVAALGYCWLAAGLAPFTVPIDIAIAVPIAAAAIAAWRGPGRAGSRPIRLRDAWPWIALAALVVAVELEAYLSAPRSAHPTLSSIADALMSTHPGRAAAIAAWLLLGRALFGRRRGDRPA